MKIALNIPGYGSIDSNLPTGVPHGGFGPTGEPGVLGNIIVTFLVLLVFTAVFFALWQVLSGGISVIMSRGNKENFYKAWQKVLFGFLGLAVVFFVFFIIGILGRFLGVDLIPFFPWS